MGEKSLYIENKLAGALPQTDLRNSTSQYLNKSF